MKSILQNRKECYFTKRTVNLHKHHIYEGEGRRERSEQFGLWVYLSEELHNGSEYGVHFDRERDQFLKRMGQAAFEKVHSREEFISLFGESYL